jgi:hypothetical protein
MGDEKEKKRYTILSNPLIFQQISKNRHFHTMAPIECHTSADIHDATQYERQRSRQGYQEEEGDVGGVDGALWFSESLTVFSLVIGLFDVGADVPPRRWAAISRPRTTLSPPEPEERERVVRL